MDAGSRGDGAANGPVVPVHRRPVWKCLLALLLSVGIALAGCLVGIGGGWPGRRYGVALFLLAPGISVCRWLPPSHFGSKDTTLAVVAGVNVLLYWPVAWLAIESALDWKRIVRMITPKHVLAALGSGAAASLISYKLNMLAPRAFAIFTVPSDWALFPVMMLGAGRWMRWIGFLRLVGGCLAYGVIAFLVLYRMMWRKSVGNASN